MGNSSSKQDATVIRFGGGLNTNASEDEIDAREASDGENFLLDPKNSAFRNREPFDLLGTAPNSGSIDGFACLLKPDGTVSMLVQAGTAVYEWDGSSFSSSKGTVAAGTKMRGPLYQNWQLGDKVIITDLSLNEEIMEWDGTTLSFTSFTDENGSAWTGDFRAKYCVVDNERAIFANVHDNGTNYPHLIVGSERGDYTVISNSTRPASAVSDEDPFFLVQPDYRPINGFSSAYGVVASSSLKGDMFKLTGGAASDFDIAPLFPRSGASGEESMAFVGNDIIYGRQGRIESLKAVDKFGDVENDDLSIKIKDSIQGYDEWVIVYNSRNQRVYCFPDNEAECWTLFKPLMGSELSPWVKYRSNHSLSFQPTAVMNMLDPVDGLEYVYMGDDSGNLYRMEGTGSGDGGTTDVRITRTSANFKADLDAKVFKIDGWITYRSTDELSVSIKILFNGEHVFDKAINATLSATDSRKVYGGGFYYGDENYYSEALSGRLARKQFIVPGAGNEFQCEVTHSGTEEVNIQEIGLLFTAIA